MKRATCLLAAALGLLLALAPLTTFSGADEPRPLLDQEVPDYKQLLVKIEPFGLQPFAQTEELTIEATGRCWYKVAALEARPNLPGRPDAVFDHQFSAEQARRLHQLLVKTAWLTAPGAEGRATHTHPTTIVLTLVMEDEERSVTCHGRRPEPYQSLLHAIEGLATQERRIYLRNHVGGTAGDRAWDEIGRKLAALRGDPTGKPVYEINYHRYLPIANQMLHPFHNRDDHELIPALRLIGHFNVKSELERLHQLAHDRSSNVRREVAWALGRLHDPASLPVLASMMSAPANREAAGLQLVQWGEPAVPYVVELIAMSTAAEQEPWQRTMGEDMIRAYLDHWEQLDQPLDPRVTAAVRSALENVDPQNGLIRTEYHREFLKRHTAATATDNR